MEEKYKQLGFKHPDFLENQYGIRIYIGTKGESDWCVEIPNKICQCKSGRNFTYYSITEDTALKVAENWTGIAKRRK